MSQSLFALSAQYQRLLDIVMTSDELSEEVMNELNAIHDSTEDKVLQYASIIKTMELQAESISKATEDMFKRAARLIKNAESMRQTVKKEMEACKLEKLSNNYHELTIRLNNPKVDENIDEKVLPDTYIKCKMQRSIDKATLLRDLKMGIVVAGARMVRETRLQIR